MRKTLIQRLILPIILHLQRPDVTRLNTSKSENRTIALSIMATDCQLETSTHLNHLPSHKFHT